MKKLFLSILLLALPLLASAADVQINGIYYNYMKNATELEVTSGKYRYSGVVNIPQEVTSASRTMKVTSIGKEAFLNCTSLTSVTIPESVTSIGRYAFRGCSGLTSVNIPESVTSILGAAFSSCTGLTSVTIPNSITKIEWATFSGCTSLTSITIPNSVTYIGESAFNGSGLTTVIIPESVTAIGPYAFQNCAGLTSITIPNSVTSIDYYAFADCNTLTSVISKMENPCNLPATCFSDKVFANSILYIPKGTFDIYKSTQYWNMFQNIVEGNPFEHVLTYLVDGNIYTTYTLEEGESIILEEVPVKEGYTFSGWSEIPETMPASDVTITGTFTINKYKLLYIVDGEEYKSSEVEFGSTISAEEAPTKEGYTFSGWSEIPETMPASDVTIIGTFTAIEGDQDKCATPTISYADKRLTFSCETEEVEYHYTITDSDIKSDVSSSIDLSATYEISVYATKSGYTNSDVATATLVWTDAIFTVTTPETPTSAKEVKESIPVLISANGGVITVKSEQEGQAVAVYTADGKALGSANVKNGQATVATNIQRGEIVIVKVGGRSVKVKM